MLLDNHDSCYLLICVFYANYRIFQNTVMVVFNIHCVGKKSYCQSLNNNFLSTNGNRHEFSIMNTLVLT